MAEALILFRRDVDIFHSNDTLAATLSPNYEPLFLIGKRLFIALSPSRTIVVTVTEASKERWGRHNWLLDIECDEMEDLRQALTYEVAGRAEIVPELKEEEGCPIS